MFGFSWPALSYRTIAIIAGALVFLILVGAGAFLVRGVITELGDTKAALEREKLAHKVTAASLEQMRVDQLAAAANMTLLDQANQISQDYWSDQLGKLNTIQEKPDEEAAYLARLNSSTNRMLEGTSRNPGSRRAAAGDHSSATP